MSDFTKEQIAALVQIADARIAEDKEITERNQAVEAHTAKLEALNKDVLDLAAEQGIDPSTFQVAPAAVEASEEHQKFQTFQQQVSDLAKEQGLDDFQIRKTL